VEKDVIYGLKQGNSVLTQLNKEMSLENVERLMSDTADAVAYQRVSDNVTACYADNGK
jgi:charged multivesicular body protein 6